MSAGGIGINDGRSGSESGAKKCSCLSSHVGLALLGVVFLATAAFRVYAAVRLYKETCEDACTGGLCCSGGDFCCVDVDECPASPGSVPETCAARVTLGGESLAAAIAIAVLFVVLAAMSFYSARIAKRLHDARRQAARQAGGSVPPTLELPQQQLAPPV